MSAAPKQAHKSAQGSGKKLTSKQLAADRANLAKARAKAKSLPRTAKQVAASRRNLAHARAVQKARKAAAKHKGAAQAKSAQAPLAEAGWLHSLPVCASVAVTASLAAWTGLTFGAADVWDLYQRAGEASIEAVLGTVAETGLAGWRLASFERADPGLYHPWLVYGVQLARGYHAVLSAPGGMLSWGGVIPLAGEPEEAWLLEWADGPAN